MSRHAAHRGLSRRSFVFAGMGTLLLPLAAHAAVDHAVPGVRLLSPISRTGKHFVARLDDDGKPHLAALPVRGHGLAVAPRQPAEVLILARRPGTLAIKVDMESGQVLKQWEAGEDRHFFGHACYSPDGRTIFVTENDIETGKGMISVHDADDFRVLAEYPTLALGPTNFCCCLTASPWQSPTAASGLTRKPDASSSTATASSLDVIRLHRHCTAFVISQ